MLSFYSLGCVSPFVWIRCAETSSPGSSEAHPPSAGLVILNRSSRRGAVVHVPLRASLPRITKAEQRICDKPITLPDTSILQTQPLDPSPLLISSGETGTMFLLVQLALLCGMSLPFRIARGWGPNPGSGCLQLLFL